MKPETKELFTTLDSLSAETCYSLVGDEPYEPFTWEIEEKGEFTVENLLKYEGNLQLLERDEFLRVIDNFQSEEAREKYKNLFEVLQSQLSNFLCYNYEIISALHAVLSEIPEQDRTAGIHVPVIIGCLTTGEWIGLTTKPCLSSDSSPAFKLPDITPTTEAIEAIAQLQTATENLAHNENSDKNTLRMCDLITNPPFWRVVCTNNRSTIVQKLLESAGFLEIREINRFFRVDEEFEDDEELEEDKRLREFYNSQLSNSRSQEFTFRVGGEDYTIHYVVGQTPLGDWIGARTISFTC